MNSPYPPPKERVATHCVCCGSRALDRSPAVLMPFVSHRVFGWAPVEITAAWGLRTLKTGTSYAICNSLQCRDCGHLFLDIRFDEQEMARLYEGYREEAYTALREHYEPGYRERNQGLNAGVGFLPEVEAFLAPHLPRRPRVLDWGGDTGINTPFKDSNSLLHIYDISGKGGLVAGAQAVGRGAALAQEYDLLVCSQVLEHVPYPGDVLQDLVQAMRPGTLLYVEVPQEQLMRGSDPLQNKHHWHEHINFFSERSLDVLLGNHGLRVVASQQLPVIGGGAASHVFQFACRLV